MQSFSRVLTLKVDEMKNEKYTFAWLTVFYEIAAPAEKWTKYKAAQRIFAAFLRQSEQNGHALRGKNGVPQGAKTGCRDGPDSFASFSNFI